MQTIDFWFDPISPYAWLAFDALPDALEGLSVQVRYRPVLLAGLLSRWGQKGPAEVPPKRDWTYRDVMWCAHRQGLRLDLPQRHPFNPLPLLRLLLAASPPGGTPSRHAVEQVFRHVWEGGLDPLDAERLEALQSAVKPVRDPSDPAVKAELRESTEQSIAHGVFGVPSVVVSGKCFWGASALDAVSACLRGDLWFDGPQWAEAARPRAATWR
ncbi:MAG: DsbA family protein [Rubrivivax sp.]|jgi:2-hydroxychromene-2-carboxylate isomerase|nr:DsbA family protein [Rubrivivax sp.]